MPSASTAATATASMEISSCRRITPAPGCQSLPPYDLSRCLVAALEPEADTADRGNELGIVRVVPQLAAQPRHVHVEGLGRAPPFGVPDLPHYLLAGDHLACLGHHQGQQVELLRGQLDFSITEPGPPSVGVDPDALDGLRLRGAAPQQST